MQFNRSRWAALGLVATLALSACSSKGDNSGVSDDTSKATGTVTWWDTSDAKTEAPKFKALIAKFEAAKPKIKIKYVNVPFSEAQEKFRTAAQANSGAPDVLRSEVAWTPDFASLGYLQDVTDVFKDTGDYLPTLMMYGRSGVLTLLPTDALLGCPCDVPSGPWGVLSPRPWPGVDMT